MRSFMAFFLESQRHSQGLYQADKKHGKRERSRSRPLAGCHEAGRLSKISQRGARRCRPTDRPTFRGGFLRYLPAGQAHGGTRAPGDGRRRRYYRGALAHRAGVCRFGGLSGQIDSGSPHAVRSAFGPSPRSGTPFPEPRGRSHHRWRAASRRFRSAEQRGSPVLRRGGGDSRKGSAAVCPRGDDDGAEYREYAAPDQRTAGSQRTGTGDELRPGAG